MAKSRIFIGLDQALSNTGYCVLKETNNTLTIIDKGVIVTKAKTLTDKDAKKSYYLDRLLLIEDSLTKLLNKYHPDWVFYEEIYLTGNRGGKTLAEVKIILELLLHRRKINNLGLPSRLNCKSSWRHILGLHSADKKLWQKQCGETNEHIADAYGIAHAGYLFLNPPTKNKVSKPK